MDIKTTLNWATHELVHIHDTAKLDAEILLATVLQKDRSYLYTWPEKDLTAKQLTQYQSNITKRKSGIPVAYLISKKEFWSLNLNVTTDTLIPRPETELLVEQALKLIPDTASNTIVDLGTGSGAIALAIASERKLAQITATDTSLAALAVANQNAVNHKLNITFILSNWFEVLPDHYFNVIISNPPYVSEQDPLLSQGDVRFEPVTALKSGSDGLSDIRFIIKNASHYLKPNGWLLLEHGFEQQQQVQQIFNENNFKNISILNDFSGHPRVSFAQI